MNKTEQLKALLRVYVDVCLVSDYDVLLISESLQTIFKPKELLNLGFGEYSIIKKDGVDNEQTLDD